MLDAAQKHINLVVRAFNDGIAFRYEFPQQNNWKSYTLLDENTTFKLIGNPTVYTLMFGTNTSSHEGIYQTLPFNQVTADTLLDMPSLFEFPNNTFMAIAEAALVNYAGMYLSRHNNELVSNYLRCPIKLP
jgi:alpha-glucosidase